MTQDTLTTLRAALEALEMQQTGLRWYRSEMPEHVNGSDDEADALVNNLTEKLAALIAAMEKSEPVGEITAEDMGAPFNAISIRTHFYKEVPAVGTKLYTNQQPHQNPSVDAVEWAVGKWIAEVQNRPLVNVHRRSLDDTWRTVIRHFGGDDSKLLPLPRHDDMVTADRENSRANVATHAQPVEQPDHPEKNLDMVQPVEQPSEVDRLRADLVKAEAFTRAIWHENERLRAATPAQPVEQPPLKLLAQALDVIKSECGYGGTNTYDPRAIVEEIEQAIRSKQA